MTVCSLELQREAVAIVNDDDVRDTGHDTERLKDCGFNRRSPTASRVVTHKEVPHSAPREMLEHGLLQLLLGATTSHGASTLRSFRTCDRKPRSKRRLG